MKAQLLLSTCAIAISTLTLATNFPDAGPSARAHVRTELVKTDLSTLATAEDNRVYTRAVYLSEEGGYRVIVKSNIGVVRMTGEYLDKELTIEHGDFTYYHSNGRIQAQGRYDHGVKAGTWERNGMSGSQLSTRQYTGNALEAMQEEAGLISIARTQQQDVASTSDTRHWSTPMEF